MKKPVRKLISGNEAVARGAWEAGALVATAYPGTPATEINEFLAEYPEINTEWSTNEKVAMEVAIGASFAGARAITSMKQVGINVAADPMFSFAYTGVNGGMVIVTADEPGLHSSQNEQDNRYYAQQTGIPMLEPSNAQEAKDMTCEAFRISEQYDIPCFIRMTTRLCHTLDVVEFGERENVPKKAYKRDVLKNTMVPSHAKKRHFDLEKRQVLLNALSNTCSSNCIEMRSLEYGVITSGISYQNVREALPDYSVLKIGMTFPIPDKVIRSFASQVKYLYIAEENGPFIENAVHAMGISAEGKEQLLRVGELTASEIRKRIFHDQTSQKQAVEDLPVRAPQFCPGCGHLGIFHILKKHKITVSGDIGCYGLGALPPYNSIDMLVCMGASIGMAHGFSKVGEKDEKLVAVIGDSTFFHSGLTGLANIVHNKGNATVIILDNRITAMTGHQPNPATGETIHGLESPDIDIAKVAEVLGVDSVSTVDGYDLKELEAVLLKEINTECVSAIVVKEKCVIVDRKPIGKPFNVNEKCVNCNKCLNLGCPAITIKDEKIVILDYLCYGCAICSGICPTGAIVRNEEAKI